MEYIAGIITALCVALPAHALRFDKDTSFYPTILIVIALYYVLFAAMSGIAASIVAESMIALLFIGTAAFSKKFPFLAVGLGLIAHGLFDLMHNQFIEISTVPLWWPAYCATVDVLLGLWVLYLWRLRT
ncbi:MAG: hypothetical protein OEZ43_15510 [Gammaproteobacteria bacterium]|nr:hypothetical protein [Gammaproteobacteria bacterium]